LLDSTGEEE